MFLFLLHYLFFLLDCSKSTSVEEQSSIQIIKPNLEYISSVIKTFDNTIKKMKSSDFKLDDIQIQNIILSEAKVQGLDIDKETNGRLAYVNQKNNFSKESLNFNTEIGRVIEFDDKSKYKKHLLDLNYKVLSSRISDEEKQLLVTKISLMNSFIG